MSLKIYKSVTGVKYNILFKKSDGRQVLVSLRGSNKSYQTKDEEIQRLIEATGYYDRGEIVIDGELEGEKSEETKPDPTAYTDVSGI